MALLVATLMLFVWSAGAQAVGIELGNSRKARLTTSDDTVVFKGKQKKSRGAFSVNLASDGFREVVIKKNKKRGKKKIVRFTEALEAGDHEFVLRKKRRVTMTFVESGATTPPAVPEPGTLALLGAGLVGLGLVGRRRS